MKAAANALLGSVLGIIGMALAAGAILTALNVLAWAEQRTFYDRDGKVIGSSTSTARGTITIYDRDGKVAGRSFTSSSGTVTLFDRDGRTIGSVTTK